MKAVSIIICWLIFWCLPAIGQKQTLFWYFGDKAGLSFEGGTPVPIFNSSLATQEGTASISSKDGELLFYTNGVTIWNKNHLGMENGSGLGGDISTTQSAIIVQHPGYDSLYYVFTLDYHGGSKGLTYSIVNMNQDNGLGKVITKNIKLTGIATEKITAFERCNKEVWVVVRMWDSDLFYSFLINKSGIDNEPIVSVSPNKVGGYFFGKLGSMKLSPDGKTIAAAHSWGINYIELGKFNEANGLITEIQRLTVSSGPVNGGNETGPYGVEFSPDSRYLYIYAAYGIKSYIYQFDVSLPTIAEIQNSRQLIIEMNKTQAGSLQLAIDQKIYVTDSYDSSLSVINQPNNAGVACNFVQGAIPLGRRSTLGLPNFITSYLRPDYGPGEIAATGCGSGTLNFTFSRASYATSLKWDFGDPASGASNTSTLAAPSHSFTGSGFFTVTLISTRGCRTDTILKKIYNGNLAVNLNDNYQGCSGDGVQLSVQNYPGVNYYWSNGARTATTKVFADGTYRVVLEAGCSVADSTTVTFHSKPVFNLGPDLAICNNQPVVLNINIPNTQYLWSTGSNSSQLTVTNGGVFWGKATNLNNACYFIDTVFIDDRPIPAINLGKDTILCEEEELVLKSGIGNGYPAISIVWQDGSQNPTLRVTREGLYYVRVSNNCASRADSIVVKYSKCKLGIPNAFTPNGDGHNDQFRPRYGTEISNYRMLIFNRFGQKLFETTDKLKGWDGKLSGKPQATGTYVWLIQYVDRDTGKQVQLSGTVVLVR